MREILSVTRERFGQYGEVIEFKAESEEDFYIVERETDAPWRLAVFRYRNRSIKKLEAHPTSKESFEPLAGITVLVVAKAECPDEYEAFILDKPICLKKGIWHQVLTLTDEAQVKITENLEVETIFYELKKEIAVQIG